MKAFLPIYAVLVISLLSCTHQSEIDKTGSQFEFGSEQFRQTIDLPSKVSDKIKKVIQQDNHLSANDFLSLIRTPRGNFVINNRRYQWTDLGMLETIQNENRRIYYLPKSFSCNRLPKYPLLDIEKERQRWFNKNTREDWEKAKDEYINFFNSM